MNIIQGLEIYFLTSSGMAVYLDILIWRAVKVQHLMASI